MSVHRKCSLKDDGYIQLEDYDCWLHNDDLANNGQVDMPCSPTGLVLTTTSSQRIRGHQKIRQTVVLLYFLLFDAATTISLSSFLSLIS